MGQFATQYPKKTLERELVMRKYHFQLWGGFSWKCWHCNKRVDTIKEAQEHCKNCKRNKLAC
jgi:hypothetical protein